MQFTTLTDRERAAWFPAAHFPDLPSDLALAALNRYAGHIPRLSLGPGATGSELMEHLMPRTMRRAAVAEWPACVADAAVSDWSTIRPLRDEERAGLYLHAYDKNAMYLAACSSVELGLYGLTEERAAQFDRSAPGYWLHCDERWHATPELAQWGYDADMHFAAAVVWQRHGRALEPWYRCIRDARAALMADESDAGRLALVLLKQTYTRAIGLLASRTHRDPAGDRYRPDWRHMIVSQARANLARNVATAGVDPVAVHVDCVYLLSPERDAVAACPFRLGTAPGQFKITKRLAQGIPVEEIAQAFTSATQLKLERMVAAWTS